VIIKRTLGAPARVISNSWTDKILDIEKENGGYEQLKNYISGQANKRYIYDGVETEGFAWAGQVMGLIKDIPTVEELFNRMIIDAEQIRGKWAK
jgi:NADH:quinone reductase (non-electrogenic)